MPVTHVCGCARVNFDTSHTGARWRRAVANAVAIAEAGAIGPLVGMLAAPTDGVRTSAADALCTLAANGARLCRCALPRDERWSHCPVCATNGRGRISR